MSLDVSRHWTLGKSGLRTVTDVALRRLALPIAARGQACPHKRRPVPTNAAIFLLTFAQ